MRVGLYHRRRGTQRKHLPDMLNVFRDQCCCVSESKTAEHKPQEFSHCALLVQFGKGDLLLNYGSASGSDRPKTQHFRTYEAKIRKNAS